MYREQHDPQRLYTDLATYYRSLVDMPTEAHYGLLAAFTFHTYTLDFPEVTHSPELVFYAVPERGKSRAGKAITHVAMRGLRTETLREANIFRWSEDLGATIFFDVMDLWKKAQREKSEDLFLNRFEKGAKTARVLNPDKGPFADTRYFDTFGATVIATNEPTQRILDTRCLTITMQPTQKRFQNEPTPDLAQPLRIRLLAWRAQQMGKPLPAVAKAFDGRFGDITRPLQQVVRCVAPAEETALSILFTEMERERLNEKGSTIEGVILSSLLRLETERHNGKVPLKRLTQTINDEREDSDKVNGRWIASRVRSLGFTLTKRNPREIVWNSELLVKCLDGYGLTESEDTSDSPSQCSRSSQNQGTTDLGENVENIEKQNPQWGEL